MRITNILFVSAVGYYCWLYVHSYSSMCFLSIFLKGEAWWWPYRTAKSYSFLYYLLTPWSRVHFEKLTDSQPAKKFPAFYGSRRFITAITSARHLSLSWASSIQSILPHPNSWRSILILSYHLGMGLPSGLFPSGFLTKTLYAPLLSSYVLHAPPISFFSIL